MRGKDKIFDFQSKKDDSHTYHYVKTIINGDIYNAIVEVFVNDELVHTIHRYLSSAFEFKEAIHELNREGFSAVVNRTDTVRARDPRQRDIMTHDDESVLTVDEHRHFTMKDIFDFVGDIPASDSLFKFWHANEAYASGSYTRADGTMITIFSIEFKTQYGYGYDMIAQDLRQLTYLVNIANSDDDLVNLISYKRDRFVSIEEERFISLEFETI